MTDPVFDEFYAAITVLDGPVLQPDAKKRYRKWFGQMPNPVAFLVTAYILAECKRRPVPAEIQDIRRAVELGDVTSTAAEALAEVHKTWREFHRLPVREGWFRATAIDPKTGNNIALTEWKPRYVEGMPTFTDPLIELVVLSMGGWSALCDMIETTSQVYWGKQFTTMYAQARTGSEQQTLQSLSLVYRQLQAEDVTFREFEAQMPGQKAVPGIGTILEHIALRPTASPGALRGTERLMIPIQPATRLTGSQEAENADA